MTSSIAPTITFVNGSVTNYNAPNGGKSSLAEFFEALSQELESEFRKRHPSFALDPTLSTQAPDEDPSEGFSNAESNQHFEEVRPTSEKESLRGEKDKSPIVAATDETNPNLKPRLGTAPKLQDKDVRGRQVAYSHKRFEPALLGKL